MKINETIESNQEIMLFNKLNQEKEYQDYTEEIMQRFKKLKTEVETIENSELKEKILELIMLYEENGGNREGYISRFAFKQGVKLGFAYGIVFKLDKD